MIRSFIFTLALLVSSPATPALAQQPTSPMEQALGSKLIQEINASVSCVAGMVTVQQQLAAAQARIKELENKQ